MLQMQQSGMKVCEDAPETAREVLLGTVARNVHRADDINYDNDDGARRTTTTMTERKNDETQDAGGGLCIHVIRLIHTYTVALRLPDVK